MAKSLLRPPADLCAAQVLGPFLDRFDSAGVVLMVHHQERTYVFGQWNDVQGMGHVLGWCRTLEPEVFAALWLGEEEPLAAESTAALGLPDGGPLDLAGLTDETLLRQVMRTVDGTAAMLVYLGEDFAEPGFWRWRNTAGAQWARATWALPSFDCPLWPDANLLGGELCPANHTGLVHAAGVEHRRITAARAVEYGWQANAAATCNVLPPTLGNRN